jgi:hypothetical protein
MLILSGVVLLAFSIFSWIGDTGKDDRGVLFIVDTSLSMSVEDIVDDARVLSSRIDTAKSLLTQIHDGTSRYALLTFATDARLQLPLSSDKSNWFNIIEATTVVWQGSPTDPESALLAASALYRDTSLHIILITDGEKTVDQESFTGVVFPPGTSISILGIGTTTGGKIVSNYDWQWRPIYKKYGSEDVISRLDTEYLTTLAKKYRAKLILLEEKNSISDVITSLQGQDTKISSLSKERYLLLVSSIIILGWIMFPDYRRKDSKSSQDKFS